MSVYFQGAPQVGDKFGTAAVSSILTQFASDTAPTNPFTDQVWLDTSFTRPFLKKWSGSVWEAMFLPYFSWNDKDSGREKNVFWQSGYQLVLYGGSSISFTYAYSFVPRIVATSSARNVSVGVYAITTTGFVAATERNDGVAANSNCNWQAIGRRDF